MRVTEGSQWDPHELAYRELIAEQKKKAAPQIKASTEQCASTQRILEAHGKGEKGIDWDAPLTGWEPNKDSALPGEWPIDQLLTHRRMQQGVERNPIGASTQSSVAPESKERAVNAFLCSPPVQLNELKEAQGTRVVTKIKPINTDLKKFKKYQQELEREKEIKLQARRWWMARLAVALGVILGLSIWWYLELKTPTQYPAQGFYKGKL